MTKRLIPSRRDVLKRGGALIVGFSFAADAAAQQRPLPPPTIRPGLPVRVPAPPARSLDLADVDAYLAIDISGTCTIYSGKVDLGTGTNTALRQIVAEELDIRFENTQMVTGDTQVTPDQGTTWGSLTIQVGGMQIRNAAATARQALVAEAVKRLAVKADELFIADGLITGGGSRATYGELVGGRAFLLKLDPANPAPTKNPRNHKFIGRSLPREDIPSKVMANFTYIHDFRVPNMLHGRVVRPPAIGARLQSVDETSVSGIPGFIKLVREGDFLGVVAENEWAAIRAGRELKATWSPSQTLPEQDKLWDHVRNTTVAASDTTSGTGDVEKAMATPNARLMKATYDFPINTHGSIGPSCAVAEFRDGKLTSWSASQATHNLRKQLATMFGLPAESVRCIYVEGAGCYGRNGHEDAAADAALLARAAGKPVRVQWSRADEHGWDPKGPPTLIDLRAAMDDRGNVAAWDSEFFLPQQTPSGFLVPLVAATLAGMPAENHIAPGNIFQNSAIPYRFPNVRTVCRRLETTPLRPSWIRTPGRMQNTFANECFADELAAVAKIDPIEFRKKYMDPADRRGHDVLDRLMTLAKWEKRPSPQVSPEGNVLKGRGMAYCKYELVRTYIGAVAEVEVDRVSGQIRVPKFYVVHDCGMIINPDGVKNQIEGNVIQTMSRTLIEEVKFNRSQVTSLDWESYPILTFPDIPDIVIDLISRPAEKPWGAGEPTSAVVPSAISNAVYDAIGVRLRSAPFTPQKVKAAVSDSALQAPDATPSLRRSRT